MNTVEFRSCCYRDRHVFPFGSSSILFVYHFVVIVVLLLLTMDIGSTTTTTTTTALAFTKIPNSLVDERHPSQKQNNNGGGSSNEEPDLRRHRHPPRRRPFSSVSRRHFLSAASKSPIHNDGNNGSTTTTTATTATTATAATTDTTRTTQQKNTGRFLLGCVAILYGTLNVSLRVVYEVPDIPPTAAALSASRGWIAFLCFLPPLFWDYSTKTTTMKNRRTNERTSKAAATATATATTTTAPVSWGLFRSGMELAVWNFFAQGLLNIGLVSTGSARASFLTQCSVIFTPLLATWIGTEVVQRRVWYGCGVALLGLLVLTLGGTTTAAATATATTAVSFSVSSGDVCVLLGALAWSIYLFRISILGPKHPNEVQLQGLKTFLVAAMYSIWWWISSSLTIPPTTTTGGSLPSWMAVSSGGGWIVWLALFMSAVGPGTIADILQQKAQKVVSASEANVILSSEPVFATLFAVFLLGETTNKLEIMGGALIICAAVIATTTASASKSTLVPTSTTTAASNKETME